MDAVTYAAVKNYIMRNINDIVEDAIEDLNVVTEDDVTSMIADSIASGAIKTAIDNAVEDSLKVKTS